MATQTSTTIQIKTKADGKAAGAMDRLARSTKSAAEAEADYQRKLQQTARHLREQKRMERDLTGMGLRPSRFRQHFGAVGGGAIGNAIGGPGGSFVGSLLGAGGNPAMAGVGVAVAAYGTLTVAAGKAADALNILNNGALTAAQKQDQFVKMIPGGETWLKLRDAISGVTEKLRQLSNFNELRLASMGAFAGVNRRSDAVQSEIAQLAERAAATAAVKLGASPVKNGATFQEDIEFQRQQRLQPLRDNKAIAEAALAAAKAPAQAALADSQKRLAEMVKQRDALRGEANKATEAAQKARARENGELPGPSGNEATARNFFAGFFGGATIGGVGQHVVGNNRNAPETIGTATAAERAQLAITQQEQRIQDELTRQKGLQLSLAEKESAVRKAQIAIDKEELAILKEKEGRLTNQSTRLGGMSAPQRAFGLAAARAVKQFGIGNVPLALQARAEQFAPDFIRKEREKFGQTTAEYKAGVKEGFLEEGNLKDIREKIGKVDTNVRMQVILDEAALAKQIRDGLTPVLQQLVKSIREEAAANVKKVQAGQQVRNASQ